MKEPKWVVTHRNGEGYRAYSEGGEITVQAADSFAVAEALGRLQMGVRSGILGDFLGEHKPDQELRLLWPRADQSVYCCKSWAVALPRELIDCDLKAYCRRVLEMGYNALVLGSFEASTAPAPFDLENLLRALCEEGVRPIIAPLPLSDNPPVAELLPLLKQCRALFWHSRAQRLAGQTRFEALSAEVEEVERALEGQADLLFYLPYCVHTCAERQKRQALWLLDVLGSGSTLSFAAQCDFATPHPLWSALRQCTDSSATPLLPLFNAGGCGLGEGLWPALPLDEFGELCGDFSRHLFAGGIALTPAIPTAQGLLDASLWVLSQLLWEKKVAVRYMEIWLKANHPQWPVELTIRSLRQARALALTLQKWISSQAVSERQDMELMGLQLHQLLRWSAEGEYGTGVSLADYIQPFVFDSLRLLDQLAKTLHLPLTRLPELSFKGKEERHGKILRANRYFLK